MGVGRLLEMGINYAMAPTSQEVLSNKLAERGALFNQDIRHRQQILGMTGLLGPAQQAVTSSQQGSLLGANEPQALPEQGYSQPQSFAESLDMADTALKPIFEMLSPPEVHQRADDLQMQADQARMDIPREGLSQAMRLWQSQFYLGDGSSTANTIIDNQGEMDRQRTPNATTLANTRLKHELNPPTQFSSVKQQPDGSYTGMRDNIIQNIPVQEGTNLMPGGLLPPAVLQQKAQLAREGRSIQTINTGKYTEAEARKSATNELTIDSLSRLEDLVDSGVDIFGLRGMVSEVQSGDDFLAFGTNLVFPTDSPEIKEALNITKRINAQVLNLLSGTAASEGEVKRIKAMLPVPGQDNNTFMSNLSITRENIKNMEAKIKSKRNLGEAAGRKVGDTWSDEKYQYRMTKNGIQHKEK